MLHGTIFDIRRFSVHDGPGIRTTIFLKGCPLDCWWCHNPESQARQAEVILRPTRCIQCGACVDACPEGAIQAGTGGDGPLTNPERCTRCGACTLVCPADAREVAGREVSVPELMAQIERDLPFFDESGGGVTISGGEPLMQPAFLLELLKACKAADLHTALDTSGYAAWPTLAAVSELVDLFLYDIKIMDPKQHRRYTGVSNEKILDNLARLSEGGAHIILRMPVIPGINASAENLRQVRELARGLAGVERVDLLPYHASAASKYERMGLTYRLAQTHTPSQAELERIAALLGESSGLTVKIGG